MPVSMALCDLLDEKRHGDIHEAALVERLL